MSIKVAVLGDPLLVERVVNKLSRSSIFSSKPRAYDLVEYQRIDASQLASICAAREGSTAPSWFIHCHYLPLAELPTPIERSTVYVASKVLSIDGYSIDYVTSIDAILPRMITSSIGSGSLQPIVEEARGELAMHAAWCLGMMIILGAFSGAEHSDDPFAIVLDVLLLVCWIWYLCDLIGSAIRIFRGHILESPSLQRNNGVLQRAFAILCRRRSSPQELQMFSIL